MKDLTLLIWLTQLGMSVALPLTFFSILGFWLRNALGWGSWTVWAGISIGLCCAVTGFRDSLKAMDRLSRNKKNGPPPVSFHEHT